MSLFTTRGTSSGSFIMKVIFRTKVLSTILLLAHGIGEISEDLRVSVMKRTRHSSSSSALPTISCDMSSSFWQLVGALLGVSAVGVPAKPLERFSVHRRSTFCCTVFRLATRMEPVRCNLSPLLSSSNCVVKFVGGASGSTLSLFADGLMSLIFIEGGGTRTPSSMSGTLHDSSPPSSTWALPLAMRSFQNSRSHSSSPWMLSCRQSFENFLPPATVAVTTAFALPAWDLLRLGRSCQGRKPVSKVAAALWPTIGPLSKAMPKSLMKRQPTAQSSSPKDAMHICLRKRKPPLGKTASQSVCSCGSGSSHCRGLGILASRRIFSSPMMFLRTSARTEAAPAGRSSLAIWR
mmetsp:Transcript_113307/g.301073  ORF Transcript_113307/g.301073 Transcript_113307/m.301073 type:complete len:349 (-) Transcript_113307:167-1213(-)